MKKNLLTVTLISLACSTASAFHPLISEDTVFLGRDVIQAEVGFDHSERTNGPDVFANTVSAEFSYGLWDKLDIMISAPWQGWNSGGFSESGLGDVSMAVKFWVAARGGWNLALKPGFSLPAGNDAKGLGAGEGQVWVYGIAGRTDGPRRYYLNAGYKLNSNSGAEERHLFSGSAAVAFEALPRTMITAELSAATNTDKNSVSHPVSSVFGLIWSPNPSLDLDAGVRLGLNDSADDLGLLVGATLRF